MTASKDVLTATPPSVLRGDTSLGFIVVIAAVTQVMVVLDTTVVNVALPSMRTGLRMSSTQLQWVIDGFLVALAGLLLLAARIGDLIGIKRVFVIGIVVFTAASLAGGLAQNGSELVIARIVQGIGAAALAPTSLSLITATHTDPKQRSKAMSIWAAAGAFAGSLGIVVGGALTSWLNWRWVLFVNVPIGIGLLIAAMMALTTVGHRSRLDELDIPGAVLATGGLGLFVYGLTLTSHDAWSSVGVLCALIGGAALMVVFVVVEARSSRPLVPLSIFANRSLSVGNSLMALSGVLISSSLFVLSLYLQQSLGYSPIRTGVAMLPFGLSIVLGALVSVALESKLGPRLLCAVGAAVSTVGLLWLANLPAHSAYAIHVLGPTLLFGIGFGISGPQVTFTATENIPPTLAGLASGLANTARQIGGAVGVAVAGSVVISVARHSSDRSPLAATVHGYNVVLIIFAGVSLLAVLISSLVPSVNRDLSEGASAREMIAAGE